MSDAKTKARQERIEVRAAEMYACQMNGMKALQGVPGYKDICDCKRYRLREDEEDEADALYEAMVE